MLNPGCLQSFSLRFSNLYNLLPIFRPTNVNVMKFLDKAVFFKPEHLLSPVYEKMLVDYELFALRRYIDRTQKPYALGDELRRLKSDTYVLLGDKDLLFPYAKSMENAKTYISSLKGTMVFKNVGHGIEVYPQAIRQVGEWIQSLT